jgi:hypothetical protein
MEGRQSGLSARLPASYCDADAQGRTTSSLNDLGVELVAARKTTLLPTTTAGHSEEAFHEKGTGIDAGLNGLTGRV